VFEFLQSISDWFQSGVYGFFEEATAWVLTEFMVWYIKAKLWGLKFAWNIAELTLTNLNVFSTIQSAWATVPAEVYGGLSFFKVPQALNMLLTAGATRFVFRLIPGI
jgi:hypothetical protein